MDYRKLPHGNEMISTIGIGLGSIHTASIEEIEATVSYAIDHGINFFDVVASRFFVYEPFGRAIKGRRDQIYTQMHFGAVYNEKGEYGMNHDLHQVKRDFNRMLEITGLGYTDFGYISCIDNHDDVDKVMKDGLWDYVCELKEKGIVRRLGVSTHTPSVAKRFLDTGMIDLFMFSINPAYEINKGEMASGEFNEREELYRYAEKLGVGITVMKPFAGGQLLDERRSPLGITLTPEQCIQYVLDRPAVICALPGACSVEDVKSALHYYEASSQERDYSILGTVTPAQALGRCVYCNHCQPCPAGIDIAQANKFFDLAKLGDSIAVEHYKSLSVKANACIQCGHCEDACPFKVKQMTRIQEIHDYFTNVNPNN